jgi:hypothetical protein
MNVSGQLLHKPAALNPGKITRYLLDRRLGGPQSRGESGEEEKKILNLPCREMNPGHPIGSRTVYENVKMKWFLCFF